MSIRSRSAPQGRTGLHVLVVSDERSFEGAKRALPPDADVTFLHFAELDAEALKSLNPDIVLSPFMTARFDCLELAQRLCALGYSGRYFALSGDLPNPELIQREVASTCPGLVFGLIPEGGIQGLKLN